MLFSKKKKKKKKGKNIIKYMILIYKKPMATHSIISILFLSLFTFINVVFTNYLIPKKFVTDKHLIISS